MFTCIIIQKAVTKVLADELSSTVGWWHACSMVRRSASFRFSICRSETCQMAAPGGLPSHPLLIRPPESASLTEFHSWKRHCMPMKTCENGFCRGDLCYICMLLAFTRCALRKGRWVHPPKNITNPVHHFNLDSLFPLSHFFINIIIISSTHSLFI